jgi:hypothetical protein
MKTMIRLAVIALIAAPSFAYAQGCNRDEAKITASSCATGTVWDETLERCITPANS